MFVFLFSLYLHKDTTCRLLKRPSYTTFEHNSQIQEEVKKKLIQLTSDCEKVTVCQDKDGDGHKDASCGGDDCDDNDKSKWKECANQQHIVKQISAGGDHTCALLGNVSVKCWGGNYDGQLQSKDKKDRLQPSEVINLGFKRTAKQISAGGGRTTCAVLDNNSVKCWGGGELLNTKGKDYFQPNLVRGRIAKQISSWVGHACVLLDDGSVTCWGRNSYGQLGLGDTRKRLQPGEKVKF